MQGRKPIPTKLKLLRGEKNKDRINTNEPDPGPGIPECPQHLDEIAREEWKRVAPILEKMGTLTRVDRTIFAGYCQLYSRWIAIENELKENALLTEKHTVDGAGVEHIEVKQNPLVIMARQTLQQIRGFCSELGMTTTSRARISIGGKSPQSGIEELID